MDGQELLFLIDSGASFTMLFDTPKGRKVSVTKGFELAIAGWGQEFKKPAYQAAVASIAFGDVVFNDLKVAYIPLSTTPYYHSERLVDYAGAKKAQKSRSDGMSMCSF